MAFQPSVTEHIHFNLLGQLEGIGVFTAFIHPRVNGRFVGLESQPVNHTENTIYINPGDVVELSVYLVEQFVKEQDFVSVKVRGKFVINPITGDEWFSLREIFAPIINCGELDNGEVIEITVKSTFQPVKISYQVHATLKITIKYS